MTERERQMIESYIPHPRDESLDFNEYYVLDAGGRCRRVYVSEILCHGVDDEHSFVCRECSTGKIIDAGYGTKWHGFRKASMYDNKEDCKDWTHSMFSGWERLRALQKEEVKK